MKQRLKLFFAFLRGIKGNLVDTSITMDRTHIEDWGGSFDVTNEKRQTKRLLLPSHFEKFVDELIKNHMDDFYNYLDLDIDEYWYLNIEIHPFENKIIFTSSCKVENRERFKYDTYYGDMSKESKERILSFYEDNEDLVKFEFDFYGRWDDGHIYGLELDGQLIRTTDQMDEDLWMITNELMQIITNTQYWNMDAGAEGNIIVWGDSIFVKGFTRDQDYEPTNMRLEINLDTYQ